MDKGTTIAFRPTASSLGGDPEPELWLVNITDLAREVNYYLGVLKAVGYQDVDKAEVRREIWDAPAEDGRADAVSFLFMAGASQPVATSPIEVAIEHLKDALDFIEGGSNTYTASRRMPP